MIDKHDHIIAIAEKTIIAGAVGSVGSGAAHKADCLYWLAQNSDLVASLGVVAGVILAIIGYVTQLIFSLRRERREQHRANHKYMGKVQGGEK